MSGRELAIFAYGVLVGAYCHIIVMKTLFYGIALIEQYWKSALLLLFWRRPNSMWNFVLLTASAVLVAYDMHHITGGSVVGVIYGAAVFKEQFRNRAQIKTVTLEKQDCCCICLEERHKGENMVELPCRHRFDSGCILKWLHTNTTCPLCRKQCYNFGRNCVSTPNPFLNFDSTGSDGTWREVSL